jgi:AFG3 family protein
MASALRHPQQLTRSSRQLIQAASLSRTLARRPASIPRPLYAFARTRQYATQPEKDGNKSATGMEHLYSKSSPMSPSQPPGGPKKPGNDNRSKLSKEEAEELDKIFGLVKKGMPASMAADVDKFLDKIKNEGMPEELRKTMDETAKDGMTPARAATFWRLTTQMARQTVEESAKTAKTGSTQEEQPKQKTAEEPGPGNKQKDSKKKSGKPEEMFGFNFDLSQFLISGFVAYLMYRLFVPTENSREITWQEFRNTFLDKGLVEKLIVVNGNRVRVHLHRESVASMYPESPAAQPGFFYYFSIGSVEAFERRVEEAQNELGIPSSEKLPVSYQEEGSWANTLFAFGPTLLFIGAIMYMSRRAGGAAGGGGGPGGIFGMGRSRAKKFNMEEGVKVKFSDVAGMDEA